MTELVGKANNERKRKSKLLMAIEEVNNGKLHEARDIEDLMRQLNA